MPMSAKSIFLATIDRILRYAERRIEDKFSPILINRSEIDTYYYKVETSSLHRKFQFQIIYLPVLFLIIIQICSSSKVNRTPKQQFLRNEIQIIISVYQIKKFRSISLTGQTIYRRIVCGTFQLMPTWDKVFRSNTKR